MHSEWSDGSPTVADIAGGMSMAEAADQRRAIEQVNDSDRDRFQLLQGIEANINAEGQLDLSDEEAATFDIACRACEDGCVLALDSDAHTVGQLSYADTALAHARLAGIPPRRILNCWPIEELRAWLRDPVQVSRRVRF